MAPLRCCAPTPQVPSLEDSIAAMGLTTGEAMPLPVERPSHGSPQPNGTVAAASAAAPPA